MDPFEACNIEFLDLSGVDEKEREEVLNSLHAENKNVKLPWKVSGNKVVHKTEVKNQYILANNHNLQNNHEMAPPSPHQVYIPSQVPYGTYLTQDPYGSPTNHAVYPPITFALHQPYLVYTTVPSNFNQSYQLSPIVATNIPNNVTYAENVMGPSPATYNNVDNNGVEYNSVNDVSVIVEKAPSSVQVQQLPQELVTTKSQAVQHESLNYSSSEQGDGEAVVKGDFGSGEGEVKVEQNGVDAVVLEKPPMNKSWASLFNKSKSQQVLANGTGNAANESNEAVNEQNNDLCPIKHPRRSQFVDPNCYRMGEFLLHHNVDGRTISLQPRGLINRSNYCYINSILQALLACPPVYNLLTGLSEQNTSCEKEKATPIIDGMCRFVKEFQHLPAGLRVKRNDKSQQKKETGLTIDCDLPFEPSWIYKMLNGIKSDSFLVEGRQEDAEEFLGCLLNGLNDEMLELMKFVKSDLAVNKFEDKSSDQEEAEREEWQVMGPKNKGSVTRQFDFVKTPISDIFGGFLKSRIHRTGDHSTSNIQPFFTLQLNIEKVKTVREALEALVTKNQLEGVTSEKTNQEVEAWQQVTLEELPVILILHLKCFDFKLDGCTKIVKALEFPIDLKIDSKLLSSKPTTPKEKQYKLFAVVYHDGKEASKGHYITDAFHVGYSSWIRYDDSSVKPVQEEHVLKPQGTRVPYLLFYRRSDTIRSK